MMARRLDLLAVLVWAVLAVAVIGAWTAHPNALHLAWIAATIVLAVRLYRPERNTP